ncbi:MULTISPECIES: PadR family transcriptional regulator [unclassified Actinoplanes]|uniref:PadR family transcriptional regulator n=1 Tax=unclassified Actinoplanes TaxID=2626549 RepID=UPI0005BB7EE9|nr:MULTISPECIES: helix-turn-helix transcriptional regulator [unclassified Actinoplanes]
MPTNALANPLVLPILGLLAERPRHAYALFSELRSRYTYLGVRNSTVYTLLNTLVDAGWLRPTPVGTDRQEFRLTPAGRQALAERVEREIRDGALGDRTAFLTALAYLGILTPDAAAATLEIRAGRVHHEQERLAHALDAATGVPELHMIEIHFYRDQLQREHAWLDATARRTRSGALAWPGQES